MVMKHPAEKNFNIFVSLLLEGIGTGLIIMPSHLGITSEILPIVPLGILGFSCFIIALLIQITTIWHVSNAQKMITQGIASFLLFIVSSLFVRNSQLVCAFSMLITGLVQL